MKRYTGSDKDQSYRKRLIYIGLIALLPFLYFAVIGYFDWTNVTEQDYEIGAIFYRMHTPMRNTIATMITRLADFLTQVGVTVIITAFLMLVKKWRTGLWYGLTVLLGSGVLNGGIKELYRRVRPDQIEHLIEQGGYSFPSGHAMGSMIVYGGLLFLIIRYLHAQRLQLAWLKWLLAIIFGVMILFIGLSRIYLGVHYPSDVIGGFSLGFTWLILSIAFFGLNITKKDFQPKNKYRF